MEGDSEGRAILHDQFADCVPEQRCTRTFCVDISSHAGHAVEGQWSAWTRVESEVTVEDAAESIDVPIAITVEEIEP